MRQIIGEPLVIENYSKVNFIFGPNLEGSETIVMQKINGKWYLKVFELVPHQNLVNKVFESNRKLPFYAFKLLNKLPYMEFEKIIKNLAVLFFLYMASNVGQTQPSCPCIRKDCGDIIASLKIEGDKTIVCEGEPFTMLNNSNIPGVSYFIWDWGDGTRDSVTTTASQQHTYFIPPNKLCDRSTTFEICLLAVKKCGTKYSCHSNRSPITVIHKPVANLEFTSNICFNTVVSFTDLSCNADMSKLLWTFHDGTISNTSSPEKYYPFPGTYSVTLNVSNECGTDSKTQTFIIGNLASVIASTPSVYTGESLIFQAQQASQNQFMSTHWETNALQLGWQRLYDNNNYVGTQTHQLTVKNIQKNQNSQELRYIVKNQFCSDTSQTVKIVVKDTCATTFLDTVLISVTDTLYINLPLSQVGSVPYSHSIRIFPNPTSSEITVDLGEPTHLNGFKLQIHDAVGKLVHILFITQRIESFPLSGFGGKGIYYITIVDPNGLQLASKKVVLR